MLGTWHCIVHVVYIHVCQFKALYASTCTSFFDKKTSTCTSAAVYLLIPLLTRCCWNEVSFGFIRPLGLLMVDFILLFSNMSCYLKYFKTVNKTTSKMHDFILEFHNNKFYFVSLVFYEIK
jgi:hypothetical protein